MSRAGYWDGEVFGCYPDELMAKNYAGALASAVRGRRGQAFLRELLEALDSLPSQHLAKDGFVSDIGTYCALGAVAIKRGMNVEAIDPDDRWGNSDLFGIPQTLYEEIIWVNDEQGHPMEVQSERWDRVRTWVESKIEKEGGK